MRSKQSPRRIVDLSFPLVSGQKGFALAQETSIVQRGFNTTTISVYSHAGTHMDAPLHFIEAGRTLVDIDLDACIGPALIVDLTHVEPDALIRPADFGVSAKRVPNFDRLLLRTDWSLHVHKPDYRTHMPRIAPDTALWLVASGIRLVGLETPSVASLRPERLAELIEVHEIFLAADVVIVECLNRLRDLRSETVEFIALPLAIDGGDGCPVRAVAVETPTAR